MKYILAANWRPQWHAQNTNVVSHNNGTQNVTPKLEIVELNTSDIKKECQVEEVKPKEKLVDSKSQNELEKLHDHVNNRVDEVQERLTLMQEALRGICISAQEKRTLDNSISDDESVTTVKSKGDKSLTAKTENSSTKFESMIKHESSTNNAVIPVTTYVFLNMYRKNEMKILIYNILGNRNQKGSKLGLKIY